MATDAERESSGNIRETLGWLQAKVEELLRGQEKLEQDLKATNDRVDQKFDRIDKKVDRLLYAIIALSGGVIVLLVLEVVR